MKPTDIPIANPVVVLREETDDWAILFNPDTCEAVGINPTGVRIWKLMDGSRDLATITTALTSRFAGVPEGAALEVSDYVVGLAARGFVGAAKDCTDR
jgi:SynChlorMet cassette protein ScmD